MANNLVVNFEIQNNELDAEFVIYSEGTTWGNILGTITNQTDLINLVDTTAQNLQNEIDTKQDTLTAGANIQIEDNVISATDTTYTAGEGISIEDNIISNTQTSAEWGNIEGDISDQTDLIDLIDTKIDIEATARENNDLLLQNGINTLNNDLTAEISNRGTADGILQGNIDTLSGTVTSNYNTLDGKITDEATARGNADTTLDGKIGDNKTAIDNHKADKNNPHEVSKSQVGLGNVDNTSDLNKPISTATQTALDGKVPTSRTVNNKALTSNITLSASDVGALPDSTVIGNGTLTIQKNGSTIDTFGANDTGNTTVNISVPTDTGDLTNNAGYIKGINSTDVTNALGYTPYNSTNPDGYTDNVGTVTSVNNTQPDANGNVTLSIPAAQVQSNWNETDTTSKAYIQNKPTIPTVGNGTITITQGGTTKGTFTTNQSGNSTIELDAGSSTDVQINGTSITSGGVADIATEGVYNATDNKIATMSELADKQDVLTAGTNISIVDVPAGEPVDTRSTATIQTVGSNRWQEVAFINDKFIAVGNSGYVVVSDSITSEGITWGTPFTVGSQTWRGIAYGNGKYVICGNSGAVAYSTDLTNWTTLNVGSSELDEVVFINNKFFMGGASGRLATSTDGITWTTHIVGSSSWRGIAYGNGKYVICGGGTAIGAFISTSTDGETWTTPVRIGGSSGTQFNNIIYENNKFVAVSSGGLIATSTDGETWIIQTVGSNNWEEVRYNNSYYVICGSSGYTSTSADGETWTTPIRIANNTSDWYGLAYGSNNFVAVGDSGKITSFQVSAGEPEKLVINGAEIVSSVDSTSTNSECVGAKLFYDTVGDIETALNTINSGSNT